MSKSALTITTLVFGFSIIGNFAHASSYAQGCTTEPAAKWVKIADVQAKAVQMGYTVAKTKVSGTCYEVYAQKDGKKLELFFHPITAALVHTVTK